MKKILISIIVIIVVGVVLVQRNISANKLRDETYEKIRKVSTLLETKPVLASSRFSGNAAYAYQLASEIPAVLDKQFCYCYCRKEHNHKNLLTCFTSDHGKKCDLCIDEVLMANDLLRKGYSIDQITAEIDDHFSKIADSHNDSH